jgi:hypothetical protein
MCLVLSLFIKVVLKINVFIEIVVFSKSLVCVPYPDFCLVDFITNFHVNDCLTIYSCIPHR